ncbi:RNA polymerase I II III common subunit [Gracilaria domingensis]|nr:RNA polymerase I II III common subunit [Gracilaria domingensis]
MLSDRGYAVLNTNEDLNLSKDDFAAQLQTANYNRESLTMLRQRRDNPADQIFVFFPDEERGKSVGVDVVSAITKRMENNVVNNALMILQTGLTPTAKGAVEKMSASGKCLLEVFIENELLVNITHHQLVPRHELMSEESKRALLRRYKLKESQLPRIQRTDPIARYYGLVPGNVVKITRPSETAGRYVTYRLCVA